MVTTTLNTSASPLPRSQGGSGIVSTATFPASGVIYTPTLRPSFISYINTTVSNVTGGGVAYTPLYNTVIEDTLSNYNASTGIFTAPITGFYLLNTTLNLTNFAPATFTNVLHQFTVNGTTAYLLSNFLPTPDSGNHALLNGTRIIYLNANDTVNVSVTIPGGTQVVGLTGGAANKGNSFGGYLIG